MKKFKVYFELYANEPKMVKCSMMIEHENMSAAMAKAQNTLGSLIRDPINYSITGIKQCKGS